MGVASEFSVLIVSRTPLIPDGGASTDIEFRTSLIAQGSVRFRFRGINDTLESSFSPFITLNDNQFLFNHNITITNLEGDAFYQFELIGVLSNGIRDIYYC